MKVPSVVGSSPIIHPLIAEPVRPGDFFAGADGTLLPAIARTAEQDKILIYERAG